MRDIFHNPSVTPDHLGGHENKTWIDEPVLNYLIARYDVKTMLDIGCGTGGMVDLARQKQLTAWGIDGDPQMQNDWVLTHDYTTGRAPFFASGFDLVWCVEFVEHVEAQYAHNFLETFDAGRVLFMTHALPGQGGHHHVNEQWDCYWIDVLQSRGWVVDKEATVWARVHSATPFGKMSGLVFTKTGRSF